MISFMSLKSDILFIFVALGGPIITNLFLTVSGVICISKNQLIDKITWQRDNTIISERNTQYRMSQRILSYTEVIVSHWLLIPSKLFKDSTISCSVKDATGRVATKGITLPRKLSYNGK